MEQHYICIFGVAKENIGISYVTTIKIEEYPGDPRELLFQIYEIIEKDSIRNLGKCIHANEIAIKSLTRVF